MYAGINNAVRAEGGNEGNGASGSIPSDLPPLCDSTSTNPASAPRNDCAIQANNAANKASNTPSSTLKPSTRSTRHI